MSRPEILFPLFAEIQTLPGIGKKTAEALAQIYLILPRDMVFHLPHSVIDRTRRASVQDAQLPATVTVEITVGRHEKPRVKGRPYRVHVEDARTSFQLVFFHPREDWLKRQLPFGQVRIVSGKVELFDGIAQMVHPDHIVAAGEANSIPDFEPVYPLTSGITAAAMRKAVEAAIARLPDFDEWIDPALVKQQGWPGFRDSIAQAHGPECVADLSPNAPARQRLAYDELFAHQLTLALARARVRRTKGAATTGDGRLQDAVLESLPYAPTGAQMRTISEIQADMAEPMRMNRLLQGDVGSGKTIVAFIALLSAVEAGGQGAIMAPTEILARQHYESLSLLAKVAGVRLEVLTGRDRGSTRAAKLTGLASGAIDILVGTHSLFQSDVQFRDLRLAVVDEQHRFGVAQRMEFGAKGAAADLLVMTATPIPRSLALAQYGDMDVSVLDEKPPGRLPIATALVSLGRLDEVVGHLRDAIGKGQQAYWVCPLVEESEVSDLTAAQERFAMLRAAFGEGTVDLVHGQMPPESKDRAMADFAGGRTKVLVATTVIEVGVDVPSATIMVVERAEHFGLTQLHQLRGRVGRGTQASTCLLLYAPPLTEGGRRRLKILRETEDGFRIAEEDLAMRGAGDLIGTAQAGLPRFRIADLESQAGLLQIAQSDARKLLADDAALEQSRGRAARALLWLTGQDRAIRLIEIG